MIRLKQIAKAVAATLALIGFGSELVASDLDCGTSGQVYTINHGTMSGIAWNPNGYATEAEAIAAAIGSISPDKCKLCPGGAVYCTETNNWSGLSFDVQTHQAPNGRWSAVATAQASNGVSGTVQTDCAGC